MSADEKEAAERGGAVTPMDSYMSYKGSEPKITAGRPSDGSGGTTGDAKDGGTRPSKVPSSEDPREKGTLFRMPKFENPHFEALKRTLSLYI